MRSVCVFCGSSAGRSDVYRASAIQTGELLTSKRATLIYGGGRVGLMGILADAVLAGEGSVIGVIPRFLATRELAHAGCTQLHTVDSMHERKALMAGLADAFIALPGGLGTFDEFCEIISWSQLGLHTKPVGLLNVAGYYDGLLMQIDRAVEEGFCRPEHRELFVVDDDPSGLWDKMLHHRLPDVAKWLQPGQT